MKNDSFFDRADRVVFQALKILSYIATVFLVAITLMAFLNVCGEKLQKCGVLFFHGIPNANVWIKYWNIPVVYLTAGYVTLESGHTNMDLLTKHYPRIVNKILGIISSLVSAGMILFITQRGVVKVLADQFAHHTRIDANIASSFPEWPFGVVYVLGFAVLAFSFLWQMLRIIMDRPPVNRAVDLDQMKQKILEDEAARESGKGAEN